jgi:hypothetical protein
LIYFFGAVIISSGQTNKYTVTCFDYTQAEPDSVPQSSPGYLLPGILPFLILNENTQE